MGGGLLMGIAGVVHADAAPGEVSLRGEIAALKAEMAQLKASQNDSWLAERRAEEFKAMVRDVLSDADTRASLLENGMSAGHNGEHFFLASDDGGFRLEVSGMLQMAQILSSQNPDDAGPGVDDEHEFGFEIRRAHIQFAGQVADPRLNYKIRLAANSANSNVVADLMAVSYEWADGVTIWAGQDKAPFLREETTSDSRQQAVDRSYVNETFSVGFVQGVGVNWDVSDDMKVAIAITDGAGSGEGTSNPQTQQGNSQTGAGGFVGVGATNAFDSDRADFALTARVDWKVSGSWGQMDDFAAWEGEDRAVFVGAAIHTEDGETGDATFNNDFTTWTIDASMESNGWNIYGAVIGHHTELEDAVVATDQDLYGYIVQGGMMLPNTSWEPFVRYESIDFDTPGVDDADLLTIGANYYLNGHNAKFTVDMVMAMDPLPIAQNGLGLQADNAGDDDQIVMRAQFQVLF
jgi:hypothetical protein